MVTCVRSIYESSSSNRTLLGTVFRRHTTRYIMTSAPAHKELTELTVYHCKSDLSCSDACGCDINLCKAEIVISSKKTKVATKLTMFRIMKPNWLYIMNTFVYLITSRYLRNNVENNSDKNTAIDTGRLRLTHYSRFTENAYFF